MSVATPISEEYRQIPDLYVNDGKLDNDEIEFLQPTCPHTTSWNEMRQRLSSHGYLFLKGLLPREDVLNTRRKYFEMMSSTGILKPGTDEVEGIFDTSKNPLDFPGFGTGRQGTGSAMSDLFMDLALKAHSEDWYREELCKHPDMTGFIRGLTGWGERTIGLERTLLRNNIPGNKAIGVHYDLIFLRHGDDSVLTSWVPLGDIKVNGGGLIYLEKGHILGQSIERDFAAEAKALGLSEEETKFAFNKNMMSGGVLTQNPKQFGRYHKGKWMVSSYEAGDVIIHNSYMIHASTINHDKHNVIRLGTDLRFVNGNKPWDTRWAKVYKDGDGL